MEDEITRYLRLIGAWLQGGYVSVHHKIKIKDKVMFPGDACSNIGQVIQQARFWAHERSSDVYLAMGAQKDHNGYVEGKGPRIPRALRKTYNTIACKSLYMDVDVDTDPKKDAYRTVEEQEEGIAKFYAETGIPQASLVVSSGRGKHLYWPFDSLIHPADFAPLAHSLVNAARSTGLKFDSQCTVDICRLLRVPSTFNYKTNHPLPVAIVSGVEEVYDIDTIQGWLAPWWTDAKVPTINSSSEKLHEDEDDLGAGVEDYAPANIEAIRKECAFIDHTLEIGGAGQSNTLWFYAVGIAASTTDPVGNAHLLSKGYHSYSETETEEKLKQIQRDRPRVGPAKCSAIKLETTECATCKHRDSGTTPVSFGLGGVTYKPNGVGRTSDQDLPTSYRRGHRGHIFYLNGANPDEPEETEVFPYKIIFNSGYIEKGNGVETYKLAFISEEAGETKPIYLELEHLADKFMMAKALARQGMLSMIGDPCRRFLVSYYSKLQEVRENIIDIPPVGWHTRNNETGFAFNGEFITPTTTVRCHMLPPEAAQYGMMGDIKPFNDLANIVVTKERPDLSVLLATAFAAPLVTLSGQQGFMMGCWSAASGIAKTTALTLAQAVWGSPLAINGLNDTSAHILAKAALLHNLPIYIDEIKSVAQITNFLNIIFQVTSGRTKARANRDSSMKATQGWELPIVFASNSSMSDAAAQHHKGSPAMIYRIFEFGGLSNTISKHSSSDVARMSRELYHNYGIVGKIYATYLGQNYGSTIKLVKFIQHDLEKRLQTNQDERFWIAAMATIMAGAYLAKKLSIVDFDLQSIEDFLIKSFNGAKAGKMTSSVDYSIVQTVVNELSTFLGPLRGRQTVVTDILWMQPGRPPKGVIKVLNDGPMLQQNYVRVQITKHPQLILRFADAELGEYCAKKGIPKATLTEAMSTKLMGKLSQARIGSGTPYSNVTELCWTFPVTGTPLEHEVEWATQYFN